MLKSGWSGRCAELSIRVLMALVIELGSMPVSAKAPKPKTSDEREARTTHFSIKGQNYRLIEFANRFGQVVRQELISPDFYEIALSRSGSGEMGKDIQALQGLKTPTKGKYLQCLRFYGLDTHASRISAAFAQYTNRAPGEPFKWRVSCDAESKALGQFDDSLPNTPPVIELGRPALQVSPSRIGDKSNFEAAFAQTFFHEMLHYSLIADEDTTGALEHCCATEDNENSASCKGVQAIVKLQNRSQIIEGEVAANLGDNYPLYRNTLRDLFGSIADQYIDKFYSETAAAYNVEADKPGCLQPKTETLTPQCLAEFQNSFSDIVDREFGDSNNGQCVTTAAVKMGLEKATDLCSRLQMASRKIYGLPSGKLAGKDPCINRKFIRGDESVAALFLPRAWADQFGSSPEKEYTGPDGDAICKLANDATGYTYNFDGSQSDHSMAAGGPGAPKVAGGGASAPVAVVTNKSMPSVQETTAAANATTGAAVANPDKGSSEIWTNASNGPKVPDYSDSPSDRENQILSDLNRNNNVDRQLNTLSSKVVSGFIPQAQAQAQTNNDNDSTPSYRQTAAVEDLTSGGGAMAQAKSVQKASTTRVSDPLASPSGPPGLANRGLTMNSFASQNLSASSASSPIRAGATVASADKTAAPVARSGSGANAVKDVGGAKPTSSSASAASSASASPAGALGGLSGGSTSPVGSSNANNGGDNSEKSLARERRSLLKALQRPWVLVKPELEKAEVVQSLTKHQIQVIDDQSRALGSGFPRTKLIYDKNVDRLVIDKSTHERNHQ